ncbi:MAG: S9 family peptidase [Gemmatimonadetes bacterium]|nr:S9 family peptidase [Gemmatimonadota bacterium]
MNSTVRRPAPNVLRRIAAMVAMAAALASASAALQAQGAKRPMTIDDIMALKSVGSTNISPNGALVTFTVGGWEHPSANAAKGDSAKGDTHENRSHVWIVPTDASAPARQLTFSERGESAPAFSPDGQSIAFISARGAAGATPPRPQIWLLRLTGGEAERITDIKEGASTFSWAPDGRSIAFISSDSLARDDEAKRARRDDPQQYEGDQRFSHVWIVDMATKKSRELTHSTEWTVSGGAAWSPDGSRIAISTHLSTLLRDERRSAFMVTVATGALTPIKAAGEIQGTPAWSPDGKTLAFTTLAQTHAAHSDGMMEREQRSTHLTLYNVAAGTAKDVYDAKQFDEDANGIKWSPQGDQIWFTATDRSWQSVWSYLVPPGRYMKGLPRQMVGGLSYSKDGLSVAMTKQTATEPNDIYFMRMDAMGEQRRLTTMNPQLDQIALGETEVITWKSSDGQEVEGILLKPVGYQPGQKVPMLVEPHGGPTGAHNAGFKASNGSPGQFWAGKGWATFYPNPRGSTGYGEKFMRGNIMDWGGGDYKDIMTGVDAVIAKGIADPEKLAVAGWSYGGYMTSWVVSQTTRFKAARMGAGLSNLESMYGTTDIPGYIGAFFDGVPSKATLAKYRERSAMTYIDQVKTPTLILHGAQDGRVPIGQPMEFFRGMKDRGTPTELWFYPREGHGFTEYYHQMDKMKREFDWIARYTLGTKVLQ